jgi:hypothetical protein
MEHLEAICDWIILLAATGTAIYKLIEFVSKPTSKIKQRKKEQLKEALKEVVPPYIETYSKQIQPQCAKQISSQVLGSIQDDIKEIKAMNIKQTNQIGNMNTSLKDILRQKIMTIYHTYRKYQALPISEREKLDEFYKDYKAQDGNSYIDKYYKRMGTWETLTDEEFDEKFQEN